MFVTCFGPGGWELYAQRFVESFVKYNGTPLTVYYHDCELPPLSPTVANSGVKFLKLEDQDLAAFKERNKARIAQTSGASFRHDVAKFAHKVFAMLNAAESGASWMCWVDADVEWLGTPEIMTPAEVDVAYLGRQDVPYAETSLIFFDLGRKGARALLRDWVGMYVTDEVFNHREWHDGWLFSRVLHMHEQNGLVAHNWTPHVKGLDAFSQGPLGRVAKHYKGPQKEGQRLVVKPTNSVPNEVIKANITANVAKIGAWVDTCHIHRNIAVLVGSGPYWADKLERIQMLQADGAKIFCVKHSLPLLLGAGVVPDFCVVLEARPLDGVSTHGFKRRTLLEAAGNVPTTFLVASMTDPAVTDFLLERGAKVLGWHTVSAEFMELVQGGSLGDATAVQGGTCAIMRSVGLAHTMGFRHVELFGVDACWGGELPAAEQVRQDDAGRPWWMQVSVDKAGAKRYWTSGEMAALVQDVQKLAGQRSPDFHVTLHSPGLAGEMWRTYEEPVYHNLGEYLHGAGTTPHKPA